MGGVDGVVPEMEQLEQSLPDSRVWRV
jgi:hypothetical protein